MKLLDILKEKLIGKKIKLYKAKYGDYIFLTPDKSCLNSKLIETLSESHGTIIDLEAEFNEYEGDLYQPTVVDDNGNKLKLDNFNSITTEIEIL